MPFGSQRRGLRTWCTVNTTCRLDGRHRCASKAASIVFCHWPSAQFRYGSSNSPSVEPGKCFRFQFFVEIRQSEKTVCVQSGARKSCREPANPEARTTQWSSGSHGCLKSSSIHAARRWRIVGFPAATPQLLWCSVSWTSRSERSQSVDHSSCHSTDFRPAQFPLSKQLRRQDKGKVSSQAVGIHLGGSRLVSGWAILQDSSGMLTTSPMKTPTPHHRHAL